MSISNDPDRMSQFILEMPLSKAEAAAEALADVGVAFDPRRATIGDAGIINYTGDNLSDVIVPIREFHREQKQSHSLRWSTAGICLSDMDAILTLATSRCAWENGQDGNPPRITHIDPESWDEFVDQFPHLIEELASW